MGVGHQNTNDSKPMDLEQSTSVHQRNIVLRLIFAASAIKLPLPFVKLPWGDAEMNVLKASRDLWRRSIFRIVTKVIRQMIAVRLLVLSEVS